MCGNVFNMWNKITSLYSVWWASNLSLLILLVMFCKVLLKDKSLCDTSHVNFLVSWNYINAYISLNISLISAELAKWRLAPFWAIHCITAGWVSDKIIYMWGYPSSSVGGAQASCTEAPSSLQWPKACVRTVALMLDVTPPLLNPISCHILKCLYSIYLRQKRQKQKKITHYILNYIHTFLVASLLQ